MTTMTRRTLVIAWVRGVLAIAALLIMPSAFRRLIHAIDPHQERLEVAQAAERQQRAAAESFTTSTGEVRRAVVTTPAYPSEADEEANQRGLRWWSRFLAVMVLLGLIRQTWRVMRAPASSLSGDTHDIHA